MTFNQIIYISNTQIPSTKANTYQSLLMSEALDNQGIDINFLYRHNNNIKYLDLNYEIKNIYDIEVKFSLIGIKAKDYVFIKSISEKWWNYIRSFTFSFLVLMYFIKNKINDQTVYSRDQFSIIVLMIYKKIFFRKIKIIFEAHGLNKSMILLSRQLDGIVCISESLLPNYSKCRKIIVLEDACRKSDIKLPNNFDYFNIDTVNTIKFLYVGNLYSWKGVYTILDSLKYLESNFEIHIAGGSSELQSEFMSKIPNGVESKLIYHGHVGASKVRELIMAADCCLIPNENVPQNNHTSPMKAFEYMASAKSIIASDLLIFKKLFLNNAIYFSAGDPVDLAKAMRSLRYVNDLSSMTVGLRKIAMKNTWDHRAKKLIKWIREDI